ncbi:Protease 2 [Planctomycetes bacterium Poly30]|uniref:Protease 2 n=1 Tax=Saltatorellus ferox TaxID=2528018 RepID=A0A518EQJ5_9BACT|nr:Protease 2 [Planctomycetes bacterium Poly30]
MPSTISTPRLALALLLLGCAGTWACASGSRSPGTPSDGPSVASDSFAREAARGRANPEPVGLAPVARKQPKELSAHGDTRIDDYYWMRERANPEVLAYLAEENAYAEGNLSRFADVQEDLFREFVGRIQETDVTVPVTSGPFEYYARTFAGKPYPVYCRRPASAAVDSIEAPAPGEISDAETVLFDVNAMARGSEFFRLGAQVPSEDHAHIAYALDRVGRRIFDVEIKNIERGDIARGITGTSGSMEWSAEGAYLFYVKRDPVTLRAFQVWRHRMNTPAALDELVYEEADETFSCEVTKSRSNEYLMIVSQQTLSTEVRMLRADDPLGAWQVLIPRERGHEYSVEPVRERLYIRTNRDAENFKLVIAPLGAPDQWTTVLRHRSETLFMGFEVFSDHLVATERRGGLVHLVVHPTTMDSGFRSFEIPFEDPAYTVRLTGNEAFDTRRIRYEYSSLRTPPRTIEFDLDQEAPVVLKEAQIGGGFDADEYEAQRIFAEAEDGAQIPLSIVYRKDRGESPGPLLLYGYGSYGNSLDATFRPNVISLLDRGFAYAIAHVRGGQELGRAWYEFGKLEHKRNTFTDFIACAEHLVAEGLTDPGQLYAQGGSAGGLLIGAVANMRPDLFHGLIADVPFVDVVTTMLDETIPLTTFEYDEWGNPNEKLAYRTMLEYSPYDQVSRQPYPNMLVTTGFHDSQVQYWEPAKWVAKLRATMTGDSLLLFDCEMEAGHGGVSGRYDRLRKAARSYGFLVWLQGQEKSASQ